MILFKGLKKSKQIYLWINKTFFIHLNNFLLAVIFLTWKLFLFNIYVPLDIKKLDYSLTCIWEIRLTHILMMDVLVILEH